MESGHGTGSSPGSHLHKRGCFDACSTREFPFGLLQTVFSRNCTTPCAPTVPSSIANLTADMSTSHLVCPGIVSFSQCSEQQWLFTGREDVFRAFGTPALPQSRGILDSDLVPKSAQPMPLPEPRLPHCLQQHSPWVKNTFLGGTKSMSEEQRAAQREVKCL